MGSTLFFLFFLAGLTIQGNTTTHNTKQHNTITGPERFERPGSVGILLLVLSLQMLLLLPLVLLLLLPLELLLLSLVQLLLLQERTNGNACGVL